MNKQPIRVKLVGRQKDYYKIAFPNLKVPVEVDENLYRKMLHSTEYQFLSGSNIMPLSKVQENRLAK